MIDKAYLSLKALGDAPSEQNLTALLLARQTVQDEAILNQDIKTLRALLDIDAENLQTLAALLEKYKESLGNLNKLAQYSV